MPSDDRNRRAVEVTTVFAERVAWRSDVVAVEEPLQIRVAADGDTQDVAITMRTPGDDLALAVGHLVSEGIVRGPDGVLDVSYCVEDESRAAQRRNRVTVRLRGPMPDLAPLARHGTMTSACGVCGRTTLDALERHGLRPVTDDTRVDVSMLIQLPARLRVAQRVFDDTGGLHAAARFSSRGELLDVREDVGRHNALDKLVGADSRPWGLPWVGQVLLLSGRASFELLQKSVVAGAEVVAAIGAPSSLAVEVAERFGVTLIGFLRADRANVYTRPDRVTGAHAGNSADPVVEVVA